MSTRYISSIDFNNKNWDKLQEKSMQDDWSRFLIKSLMNKYISNKLDSVQDTVGNICFDLRVRSKLGIYYGMEVKFRKDMSTKYKTHLMNKTKYVWFNKYRDAGVIQDGYLFTIWYDGVISVSHVFENYIVEQHLQNKTTNVSATTDYTKELKDCYCYNKEFEFYFCYEYDEFTKTLRPYFSKEPIDINALNNAGYKTVELF